jgi:hypothetical protein
MKRSAVKLWSAPSTLDTSMRKRPIETSVGPLPAFGRVPETSSGTVADAIVVVSKRTTIKLRIVDFMGTLSGESTISFSNSTPLGIQCASKRESRIRLCRLQEPGPWLSINTDLKQKE